MAWRECERMKARHLSICHRQQANNLALYSWEQDRYCRKVALSIPNATNNKPNSATYTWSAKETLCS